MPLFGWCMRNDSDHANCPGKYQKFYFGTKKVNKKTVETIIYLDEFIECDCKRHRPAPVRRTAAKRRKIDEHHEL